MKINTLLLVPVAVSSVALDASSRSATAFDLMSAVGHRNITNMEALVQNLADESVNQPGWKFDKDIQNALKAIQTMFVKSIQKALNDEHSADQKHFNCFTKDCFGGCIAEYTKTTDKCEAMADKCDDDAEAHDKCRHSVNDAYQIMAKDCGKLHCFDIPNPECKAEDCLCPDVDTCHKKSGDDKACEAKPGDGCKGKFGDWLHTQLMRYKSAYDEWRQLHVACKKSYHAFLSEDMVCDAKQKQFETCMCQQNQCELQACNVDYDQCEGQCWGQYEKLVKEKECLEKDRKIDWSATKKIECYIDVLLHDYSKKELLSKCGADDCISKAREHDYKQCATICPQVDYEGYWPEVRSVNPVKVVGHKKRKAKDDFLLGDGQHDCDLNGDVVFTKHRGGVDREDEVRCTEHLDIDYQIPQCMACKDPPEPVCDAAFHEKYYSKFDDTKKRVIEKESDCCLAKGATCFGEETFLSSNDGESLEKITVTEHSQAWAYNRCPCTECVLASPKYQGRKEGQQCGMGAHTISPSKIKKQNLVHKNVCVEVDVKNGNGPASIKVDKDVCVKSIKITHLEGTLSCNHQTGKWSKHNHKHTSNWGCQLGGNMDTRSAIALVLADGKQATAPVFDGAVGMTPYYYSHWYRMDGVDTNSTQMSWIFHEPVIFQSKEYKLWYSEDFTGQANKYDHGRACYDLELEPAETCDALAPLQFTNVCAGFRKRHKRSPTITLPQDTCVTEIALHLQNGRVRCNHRSKHTHFGCRDDIGIVWTKGGKKDVIMPHGDQIEGFKHTGDRHAHRYSVHGLKKSGRALSMKIKEGKGPVKVSGELDLWFSEDLVEGDNAGRNLGCFDVSVHRALKC